MLAYTIRMQKKNVLVSIHPYSHSRLDAIARLAKEHRWNVTLAEWLAPNEDLSQFDGALITLRDTPPSRRTAHRLKAAGISIVDLTEEAPDIVLPRVVSDHVEIGRKAARHFAERGFENLAWFSSRWTNVHRLRFEGYKSAAPDRGAVQKFVGSQLNRKLPAAKRPLAILTYNEHDAAIVVATCRAHNLDIPREVSVLSIGNDPLLCECRDIPLSSIDPHLGEAALQAAALLERLMHRTARPSRPPHIIVPPGEVVVRESSNTLANANPTVNKAIVYIHMHLHKSFGTNEVAQAIGTSNSTVNRLFRNALQRTVAEEIRRQRLMRVRHLLSDKSVKISDIAAICGFSTPSHLTNAFRQETGLSPKAWQHKTGGREQP